MDDSSVSATNGTSPRSPHSAHPLGEAQTLDETLESCVGVFGMWQAKVSILAALLKFPVAWFQLGIVFLAPPTHFWCRRPPQYSNMTLDHWLELITPNNSVYHHQRQSLVHGSCYMRNPILDNVSQQSMPEESVPCIWGYEFDTNEVRSSIITEWELVCGKEWLVDFSQVILMAGILLGNVLLGIIADRYGRKPVLLICLIIQTVCGIISSLAPTYPVFILTRFLTAFGNGGTVVISFVICMEVVGGKWRTIVPILCQIPFGIGNALMAIAAYFIRDWRQLQLFLSGLSAFFWIYWRWMPESPRWLLATGRREKAIHVLERAAVENQKSAIGVRSVVWNLPVRISDGTSKKPNISALFLTPIIRKKTILLCLQWFLSGVSFYGFSQYMGAVTTRLYLMVVIVGLISMPGTLLCCFVVQRYGRRITIAAARLLTGLCYLAILFVVFYAPGTDNAQIALAALGFIGMSISMPALYLFTAELFPTVLRNAGVGASLMCSRIGGMLAPFVNLLADRIKGLPLAVLGCMVLMEAFLVIPLPETKDTALPDTVNDAEVFVGVPEENGMKKREYSMVSKSADNEDVIN